MSIIGAIALACQVSVGVNGERHVHAHWTNIKDYQNDCQRKMAACIRKKSKGKQSIRIWEEHTLECLQEVPR